MNYSAGTSGLIEVGVSLVLKDRFTEGALKAHTAIRQLNNEAKRAVNSNISAGMTVMSAVENASAAMLTSMVSSVMDYGKEYIDTMTTVSAITGATTADINRLSETALDLGMHTMFASQDVASGMKYLAMAGNSAQEINEMINASTYAAAATGLALGGKGGAADMLTNVMRAFKLHGKEAADTLSDQLVKATLSSNISMQDLAESIKYSAADMVSLGRTVPEVAAMIGTLGNAGIQGSMAGTALSNMSRYLLKALTGNSQKGAKALESLGISLKDLTDQNGNLKDMYTILSTIQKATANMTSVERTGIFQILFGARGFRAANALMNDINGFKDLQNQILNSQGYAQKITETRMSTLAGSINMLKSAWENLKVAFSQSIEPWLTPIIKGLAQIVTNVGKFVGTKFGGITTFVTVFGGALTLIIARLAKMRLQWQMWVNDGMVSGQGIFRVLVGGWSKATLTAKHYEDILRRIRILQSGVALPPGLQGLGPYGINGTAGKMGKAIRESGMPRSYWMGQVRSNKKLTTDEGYRRFLEGRKRRQSIIPSATYTVYGRDARGRFTGVNQVVKRTAGQRVAGTFKNLGGAARVAGRGALGFGSAAVRGMAGLGSGLLAFMGGPWGLLAMAGITLISQIPNIISSINNSIADRKRLRAELERNTAAANTLAGRFETEAQRKEAGIDLTLREEMILMLNTIQEMAAAMANNSSRVSLEFRGNLQDYILATVNNENRNTSHAAGTK